MILGKVHLNCENMPCYTFNKLHGWCIMDGCEEIHETIQRFGHIVGMQIVTKAMWNYEPGDDMESLLEYAAKKIVGTR